MLDMDKVELTRNADWLGPLRMDEVLRLTSTVTVARMLERDDFSKRYQGNEPISMLEFMYPLLQGYDSVAVKADVELGGTDQKFNLLMGRTIMEAYGLQPQSILTVPLLVGTDGEQKMSKSYGNYVGVSESAGRDVRQGHVHPGHGHAHLLEPAHRCEQARGRGHRAAAVESANTTRRWPSATWPSGWCRCITRRAAGQEARARFDRVFKEKDDPDEIVAVAVPAEAIQDGRVWVPRLLTGLGLAASNGEARRADRAGRGQAAGEVLRDPAAELDPASLSGAVLQVGKRKFVRFD